MTMHAVMHGDILRNYTIIKVADVALKTILKKNSKFFSFVNHRIFLCFIKKCQSIWFSRLASYS